MTATVVYTDGACSGNPGPGGWAWAVPGGAFASGAEARSTNQRMEVKAALEAVTSLDGEVEVVSDSTYVVNCFRDRWWEGWLRRGWLNTGRRPVANRDLWEPLVEAYRADPGRVRFRWVKGHSGDAMNDLVDGLAVEAAATQRGRRGDHPPDPAPAPGRAPAPTPADPRRPPATPGPNPGPDPPAGRRLVVVGHRPPALGGYGPNPVAGEVRRQLAGVLEAKGRMHPDLVVLTGLGLGAEQLGAEAAHAAGVPFVAVLAYPDPHEVWPADARRRYLELLGRAASTVVLQGAAPRSKQAAGAALARRDGWLARHAHEAVAVWDGQDPAVGRTVRSFQDAVGEEEVWVLHPPEPGAAGPG